MVSVSVAWDGVVGSSEAGDGVMVIGLGRRVSGYSSSNRWIMRSRVESRNWRRSGRTIYK